MANEGGGILYEKGFTTGGRGEIKRTTRGEDEAKEVVTRSRKVSTMWRSIWW